ncbi:MAG: tetratricopeptide repeat protein [Spirochaetes bacterium]|nr:tetratricopeptide repeat protein [Spirochaetota bacterium]
MPSISELNSFKDSFQDVGDEKKRSVARGQRFNDLDVPETEGAPLTPQPAAKAKEPSAKDEFSDDIFNEDALSGDASQAGGADDDAFEDFSFEDDAQTGDDLQLSADAFDDPFNEDSADGVPLDGASLDEASLDDASFDDASLADTPFDEVSFDEAPLDEGSLLSDDDFPSAGTEGFEMDFSAFVGSQPGELNTPPPDEIFNAAPQDDAAQADAASEEGASSEEGAENLPKLSSKGLMGKAAQHRPEEERREMESWFRDAGEEPPLEEESDFNFDLGLPSGDDSDAAADEGFSGLDYDDLAAGDDSISLDDADAQAGEGAGSEDESDAFGDDFNIPDIDDFIKKPKAEPSVARVPVNIEDTPDDVSEIQLTEAELEKLQKTLASYPLNLKIACQEIIAEHVVPAEQLSKLIKLLVRGASLNEAAALASEILERKIIIPKSFERSSGEALEAEQATFTYIFFKRFLPVLRLFSIIAILAACVAYLSYRFIYIPQMAESIYRRGYEQIYAGNYTRANELFWQAFEIRPNRNWFYRFAEAYINQRRFLLAQEKYEALLWHFPGDRRGILDFAHLQTYHLMNFERASEILRHNLLDFNPDDFDGLLALGDNYLAWGDSNPLAYFDMYENARAAYARLMENVGWQPALVERMMRYFIRTDNLREVLFLNDWFRADAGRTLSTPALTEVAGYLLDKQLETPVGVPSPYLAGIEEAGVLDMLLQAVHADPSQPEPHYHLARYFGRFGSLTLYEERLTLSNAILAFDIATEESVRRRLMRIDAHRLYANALVRSREFFAAEYHLMRGIALYEDFLGRGLINPSPEMGRLFSDMGDLEFFVKAGDMEMALHYYHIGLSKGWAPPEVLYRMGAAYYQLQEWGNAMEFLFRASSDLPLNRRLLFALGNASFQRGDFFAAQGYYSRLLAILETQRSHLPILLPNDNPAFLETGERLMMARNNAGVVYEMLATQTGNAEFMARAISLFADSSSAWDSITRNPALMTRESPTGDFDTPGVNLAFLNLTNALSLEREFPPAIFVSIDKDVLEPSNWESLLPNPLLGELAPGWGAPPPPPLWGGN